MRELSEREIDVVGGGAAVAALTAAWPDGLQASIDWTSVPRIGSPIVGPLISPTIPPVGGGFDLGWSNPAPVMLEDEAYGGS